MGPPRTYLPCGDFGQTHRHLDWSTCQRFIQPYRGHGGSSNAMQPAN